VKKLWIIPVIACMSLLGGCGMLGIGNNQEDADLSGNWVVTMQPSTVSSPPYSASGFLNFHQGGGGQPTSIDGVFAINNGCTTFEPIQGTVDNQKVTFNFGSASAPDYSFVGTSSSNNNVITGTYISGICNLDNGAFEADRVQPLKGTLGGSLDAGSSLAISGSIDQGSTGNLTGTLKVANWACFASGSIIGTISGTSVNLKATSADGSQQITFTGTSDLAAKNVSGTYSVLAGSCASATGTATLKVN
jgi:hypothetical protein